MIIAVVIPCYKVKKHILSVINGIGNEVTTIYVIDDHCPEHSGDFVNTHCQDSRVKILYHKVNLGVGAAMVTGYRQAIIDKIDIVVKVDGDGQMNTDFLPSLVQPIIEGVADYTKGNRFFDLESLANMPRCRLFGNSILSLINKMSSGYWNIMDPTNGFTAIHHSILSHLPLSKLDHRFFFESDMLFRLGVLKAVVLDIPVMATYANEKSNLSIGHTIFYFPWKYLNRILKRIFYNYFLRDFNAGTVAIVLGFLFLCSGSCFGLFKWYHSLINQIPATSGTVMLAGLPILIGSQLLISALNYDINMMPTKTFQSGSYRMHPRGGYKDK